MKHSTRLKLSSLAAVVVGGLITAALAGCQTGPAGTPALLDAAPALADSKAAAADAKPVGRAQLWSQTCNRCHNTRSPDSYSGAEWSLVMTHMRVRGYLTGQDQRAIQEFLQSQ